MSIEQQLREQFDHATEHLGSADLDAVLDHGRSHRRRRIGTIAVGSAAAAAAVALAVTPLVHDRVAAKPLRPGSHSRPVASATHSRPAISTDPVAQRLQAAVATAAPELPAPSKLYPSDWNHNTPLPDSQAANATDWQLGYNLPGGEVVWISVFRSPASMPESATCEPPKTKDCSSTPVPGGRYLRQITATLDAQGEKPVNTAFVGVYAVDGGLSGASVSDTVSSPKRATAERQRSLTDAQLRRIATASDLTFPAPVVTPPPPTEP